MKANELRIGNYVLHRGKIKATNIEIIDDARVVSEILVEEIPLTEEWLVKLGIEKKGDYFEFSTANGCVIELLWKGDGFDVFIMDVKVCFLKHVHMFQNLYFALTGEELTIK